MRSKILRGFNGLIVAVMLFTVVGCGGYKKRMAEVREQEQKLAERGMTLSEWADELDAQELRIEEQNAWLKEQLAQLQRERKKVELRAVELEALSDNLDKIVVELEGRYKEGIRGAVPSIVGKRAIVIDVDTGVTLYEKNADEKAAVASTQKLLTGLIVAKAGDLDAEVIVEEADTRVEPTKLYIKTGEKYLRRDLLQALLIKSGNDLALCLARDNAGSKEAFATRMNEQALALGMENSNFINPHGLTEKDQYSTARDMAKLAMAAYRDPVLSELVKTHKTVFTMADGTEKILVNTNRVLRDYAPCNGMKTGYTVASGYCLVCSGSRDKLNRIVIVLGSDGRNVWNDSRKLLEWALKA